MDPTVGGPRLDVHELYRRRAVRRLGDSPAIELCRQVLAIEVGAQDAVAPLLQRARILAARQAEAFEELAEHRQVGARFP